MERVTYITVINQKNSMLRLNISNEDGQRALITEFKAKYLALLVKLHIRLRVDGVILCPWLMWRLERKKLSGRNLLTQKIGSTCMAWLISTSNLTTCPNNSSHSFLLPIQDFAQINALSKMETLNLLHSRRTGWRRNSELSESTMRKTRSNLNRLTSKNGRIRTIPNRPTTDTMESISRWTGKTRIGVAYPTSTASSCHLRLRSP